MLTCSEGLVVAHLIDAALLQLTRGLEQEVVRLPLRANPPLLRSMSPPREARGASAHCLFTQRRRKRSYPKRGVGGQRVAVTDTFLSAPPPNGACGFPRTPLSSAHLPRPYAADDFGKVTAFVHLACLPLLPSQTPVSLCHVSGFPALGLLRRLPDHRTLDP